MNLRELNSGTGGSSAPNPQPVEAERFEDIRNWLLAHVARELDIDPSTIDPDRPLTRYGLDSLAAATLSGELEIWLERELPGDLLTEAPTINAISRRLAGSVATVPQPAVPMTARPGVNHDRFSSLQLRIQTGVRVLSRWLYRIDIEGLPNVPATGAFIIAANHLHILDAPLLFGIVPRPMVLFASDHMRRVPLANWFLKHAGNAIYVRRGEADQEALAQALDVLRSGGGLAMAPEGKISKTGGLLPGHPGIGHLAAQSAAPIVPLVMYGHERPFHNWIRLRRAPVHVRIGKPIHLPVPRPTSKQLESYRDTIMIGLGRLLPREYRGVYRNMCE